jgi:hypothetical protein
VHEVPFLVGQSISMMVLLSPSFLALAVNELCLVFFPN